ncbi:hypothetical protein JCM8208_005823 [Rhodotorula glutinis]
MALDPSTPTLDAVTRVCYARGLPCETWLALVRQAAEEAHLDHTELERQLSAALVALLTSGTAAPSAPAPPLVAAYLSAALGARVCGPAAVAHAACGPSPSSSSSSAPPSLVATEAILRTVLLSFDTPSAPSLAAAPPPTLLDPSTRLSTSLLPLLDALIPLVRAHPDRAQCTAAYLARVARAAAAAGAGGGEEEEEERALVGERVRRARDELEAVLGVGAQRGAAELRELCQVLRALEERVVGGAAGPGGAGKAAGGGRARIASGRGGGVAVGVDAGRVGLAEEEEEDEESEGEALSRSATRPSGDVAFFLSSFLWHPHAPSNSPTHLSSTLSALIVQRLAHARRRRRRRHAGAVEGERAALGEVLAEVLGGAVRLVGGAAGRAGEGEGGHEEVVVLEACLLAKLPHALKGVLEGLPQSVGAQAALAQAVRAVRESGLGGSGAEGEGMEVDGANSSSSSMSQTFDSLVVALGQRELLSSDSCTSLVPHVDASELQPAMVADYSDRLAGAGQDEVKQLLDELVESCVSQQAISTAIAEDLASKSTSHDIVGLSTMCDALVDHREPLAVLLVHVEARDVLGPVRAVLDEVDTSQDDFDDGNPIERYGGLVLFVQLVASRFKLHSNLAHHLGSTSSFFTTWLPSCSAVYALSTLSDDERSVVSGWIGALFGEGISDDLMHATNPRTLLRVAPTILKQSLMARQAGVVDLDSLRDALSYFLQELLRFTLPGVLLWLVEEVERTSASPQQLAMLDILQTLVLAPSLPPSIIELVAPFLVRLLLGPSISSLPSSALDRAKLIKLVKPFRPSAERALCFAAPQDLGDEQGCRTPHEAQLRAELAALVAAPASGEGGDAAAHGPPPPPDLARSFARARALAPRGDGGSTFLRGVVLPSLFAAADSATTPSSAVHVERAVVALIGSSSSSLSAGPASSAPLLPVLVGDVILPDLESWARTPVAAGAGVSDAEQQQQPQRRRRRHVELVADVVAGAAVWTLELEKRSTGERGEAGAAQETKRALQLLSDGVAHARRSGKHSSAGKATGRAGTGREGGADEVTVLDAFLERLASWPDVVEASPTLAALASLDEP